MNIDFSDGRFWIDLVQSLLLLGLFAAQWLRKPGQEAAAELKAYREEVDEEMRTQGHRLTVIEQQVSHAATHTDLAELEGAVRANDARVEARLNAIQQGVQATQNTVARIEDFLRANR